MTKDNALYRINCGGPDVVDSLGRTWQADRPSPGTGEWGAVGGNTVVREPALPINSTR